MSDYPTPKPRDRVPPSIEEQASRIARDTDPAPEDPIITALRNMMRAHEDVEMGAMSALRNGIRKDFREEAARLANPFLERDEERRKQVEQVLSELEQVRGRLSRLEQQVQNLIGDER